MRPLHITHAFRNTETLTKLDRHVFGLWCKGCLTWDQFQRIYDSILRTAQATWRKAI